MTVFIGYISALEYWRLHEREGLRTSKAFPQPGHAPSAKEVQSLPTYQLYLTDTPLCLNVATIADRRNHHHIQYLATGNSLPTRSYIKIVKGIYVCTPEACFLQLAHLLPLLSLIELGYELCGSYSLHPHTNAMESLSPRMTTKSLEAYLNRARGCNGSNKAKRALRYLADNSASPMETKLTMLLCMPVSLGGYGLPKASMNMPIALRSAGIQMRYCDIYWPQHKFALEYDSNLYHSGAEKLNHDSARRTLLEAEGIRTLSVTNQQIRDEQACDKLANTVAKYLHHQIREERYTAKTRLFRRELRRTLLGSNATYQAIIRAKHNCAKRSTCRQ